MTRALSIFGNVIFGLMALVLGGGVVALTMLPPVLHYQTYVVLSGSMEPAIPVGSVVVATAAAPESLRVGDVVTYVRPGDQENVTHRIAGITGGPQGLFFTTKGDANGAEDQQEVRFDRLAGKVTMTIPFLGYFFKFAGSANMRFLLVVVPGILLLGSWLWEVWRPEPKDQHLPEESKRPEAPASSPKQKSSRNHTEVAQGLTADAAAAVPARR